MRCTCALSDSAGSQPEGRGHAKRKRVVARGPVRDGGTSGASGARIDEAEIRRHERGRCLAVLLEMVSEGRIGAGSNAMLAAIEGIGDCRDAHHRAHRALVWGHVGPGCHGRAARGPRTCVVPEGSGWPGGFVNLCVYEAQQRQDFRHAGRVF